MKSCSTCNKTYTDETSVFVLTTARRWCRSSEDRTIPVSPRFNDDAKTGDRTDWNAAAYQPPVVCSTGRNQSAQSVAVGSWNCRCLHSCASLVLRLRSRFLFPGWFATTGDISSSDRPVAIAGERNTNQQRLTQSRNSNSSTRSETKQKRAAPTHQRIRTLVLAQLKNLEHEWTVANINADKKQLDKILADDYVGTQEMGGFRAKLSTSRTFNVNFDPEVGISRFEGSLAR